MKAVPGICDRCGLRFKLSSLRDEYLLGRPTGMRVCSSCYDESHPQLDTRGVKTSDRQSVKDSRSDKSELAESRRLFGWNPVGMTTTSTMLPQVGNVRVIIGPSISQTFVDVIGDEMTASVGLVVGTFVAVEVTGTEMVVMQGFTSQEVFEG